jgi:hypothetical protein
MLPDNLQPFSVDVSALAIDDQYQGSDSYLDPRHSKFRHLKSSE